MPSDIKERVVARNVKTLDRAALLQKAARPAALRVGETAKAANPAHTRERRGDEAEGVCGSVKVDTSADLIRA